MKFLRALLEAEYGSQGYCEKTKTTDPKLSPQQRGEIAANVGQMGMSLDWNEETDEYNPYPKNSREFDEYAKADRDMTAYLTDKYPHV